jgi:acetyltransferase-like isoleucine patch superfamily enzyme
MVILNEDGPKKTIKDVKAGKGVKIYDFVNLYGCELGDGTQIGTFVEIQKGARVGKKCRIQSHTFICEGVTINDEVFIGHGVMFINDKKPSIEKTLNKTWKLDKTLVKKGAVIGTGAIIFGGLIIGENAFVGAGSVVTKSVDPNTTVIGNPAKVYKKS